MAEKSKPADNVKVTLDKPRSFRYTLDSLESMEDALDLNVLGVLRQMIEGNYPRLRVIRQIAWYGCLSDDPDLVYEDFKDHITSANLPQVIMAVTVALSQALAGPDKKKVT